MIAIRRNLINTTALILISLSLLFSVGCDPATNTNTSPSPSPSPSASPTASPTAVSSQVPVTLPVLDALFSEEAFKSKLKTQIELTDAQVTQLQKIAADEVAKLRQSNVEDKSSDHELQAEQARQHASEAIREVVGEQKA